VDTEILVYRVVELALLICAPVAVALKILPARSLLRKRIRWGAVAFIRLGFLFFGSLASWPGRGRQSPLWSHAATTEDRERRASTKPRN
jgi:hypothetical protein